MKEGHSGPLRRAAVGHSHTQSGDTSPKTSLKGSLWPSRHNPHNLSARV